MSQLMHKIINTISIPEYYKTFIDSKVDLNETPAIPCIFHGSDGNKFTYSPERNLCRCWSKCGGGNVIWLHQKNYHLKSKEEAVSSLAELLGIHGTEIDFSNKPIKIDELLVKMLSYIAKADSSCRTINDYLTLDLIMSQRKPPHELIRDLEVFLNTKGVHL